MNKNNTDNDKKEDDYHLRHQVIDTGFSAEDDRIYEMAMIEIRRKVQQNIHWDRIIAELKVVDEEIKRIVLDDFLKITVAERHFQGQESLKRIGQSLHIPMDRMLAIKQNMLREVEDAAINAYHLSRQQEENKNGDTGIQYG
ncbi:MAG: hypothetical protein HQL58_12990 [Magnetococcales bacterium]|nr:hypothetical protein [Magnetococcales bacterium]